MHFNGSDQRHGFSKCIRDDVLPSYSEHIPSLEQVLGPDLWKTTGPSANAIIQSGPGRSGYQAYDELHTIWADSASAQLKTKLQLAMLRWLAQCNYWNAGYKQKTYRVSWSHDGQHTLIESHVEARDRPVDL